MQVSTLANILELLRRRPCTVRDVSSGLRIRAAQVAKELELLARDGLIGFFAAAILPEALQDQSREKQRSVG